ncbi:MAG: hypothetical protein OEZ16_11355 [Chromatiales bacterium]|nr:hypothetical protein [Chromatiales bacterium]
MKGTIITVAVAIVVSLTLYYQNSDGDGVLENGSVVSSVTTSNAIADCSGNSCDQGILSNTVVMPSFHLSAVKSGNNDDKEALIAVDAKPAYWYVEGDLVGDDYRLHLIEKDSVTLAGKQGDYYEVNLFDGTVSNDDQPGNKLNGHAETEFLHMEEGMLDVGDGQYIGTGPEVTDAHITGNELIAALEAKNETNLYSGTLEEGQSITSDGIDVSQDVPSEKREVYSSDATVYTGILEEGQSITSDGIDVSQDVPDEPKG